MLELSQVHLHYDSGPALRGVDLVAAPGEIVGLFGRNGAGKSTLLKCIAGWLRPQRGLIRFQQHELQTLAIERICRLGVATVPEDRRIFPDLSVEENLALGLLQAPGRSRSEQRAALQAIYEEFPLLAQRRAQLGGRLSGGEQQLLAIARLLAGRPRLLLLDESTEGLSPAYVDTVFAILRRLCAAGAAVLLVEQNVARALELCGPMVVLERGQVVCAGHSANPADREQLYQALRI